MGILGGKPSTPAPAEPKPAPPPPAETAGSLKIPADKRAKETKAKSGSSSLLIKRSLGGSTGGSGLNI